MHGAAEAWFGTAFAALAPGLQTLHRDGGTLSGPVHIVFPGGLRGWAGRTLARRLGIPCTAGSHRLRVDVASAGGVLHWRRCFDDGAMFASVFVPVDHYPDGHWTEQSGALGLRLGVAIIDGAWHWQHRATRVHGIALPAWLAPRMHASKEERDGVYRFAVALALPLLGTVLSYAGELAYTDHTSV